MKRALITGITGQDGSYLAELLLAEGYEVHGIKRRSSQLNTSRIDHLYTDPHLPNNALHLHYGDVTDAVGMSRLITHIEPHEIYHLAAMSHVRVSFDQPELTAQTDALPILTILETVLRNGWKNNVRIYNASTSELFGASVAPQNEATPFKPASPYGLAKLFAHEAVRMYRQAYGLWAVSGILFNHESPRRGETFVSRKVTRGIARILAGRDDAIFLGNLNAVRDWGHARDLMRGAIALLRSESPRDRVIATGQGHSVQQLIETAFATIGISLAFDGHGAHVVHCADPRFQLRQGKKVIAFDGRYLRPLEIDALVGDSSLFRAETGWQPTVSFNELVAEMVWADLAAEQVWP